MDLIECVPNISEGQRQPWLDALAGQLRAVPGLVLLDYSGDPAHHRSVFTMAGDARALHAAVMTIVEQAVRSIDLRTHRGEHPRIGAVDVVPFIPLRDTPMDVCVTLARRVGADIAERFAIPVYLYEDASRRDGRRRLDTIRRGQFEGLAEKMAAPEWAPDFGPVSPHPSAGATAVGARRPLIAFNVNLATDRVDVARQIARTIRESSGGLACVKALGFALHDRGIVQVSMNLTDFTRTSVQTAFDRVSALAAQARIDVLESELIGLIPEAALEGTSPDRLGLRGFDERQILERRLAASGL